MSEPSTVDGFALASIPPLDTSRPFLDIAREAFARYETEEKGPASFGFFLAHDNFLWSRILDGFCGKRQSSGDHDYARGHIDALARKHGVPILRGKIKARTLCEIAAAYPELAANARLHFISVASLGFTFPDVKPVQAAAAHFQAAFGVDPEKVFVPTSMLRERWPRILFETTIYPTPDLWKGNKRLFQLSRVLAIESDNVEAICKKSDISRDQYDVTPLARAALDAQGVNVGALG